MSHFIDATLPAGHPHMYLIILEYCDVLVVFDALLSLLRLSCNYHCCCRWWLHLQSHSWCCIIILTCLCAAGSKILLSVTCHCTVAAALTLRAATLTSSCSPLLSLSSDRLPPTPSSPWDLRSSRFSWLTAASYTPPWKSSASMPSDLLPVTCRKKERRRRREVVCTMVPFAEKHQENLPDEQICSVKHRLMHWCCCMHPSAQLCCKQRNVNTPQH